MTAIPAPAQDAEAPEHSEHYRKCRDALREALDAEIEIPEELKKPVASKVLFQKLRDLAAEQKLVLPIWIDQNSFREHDKKSGKRSPDILETKVVLPEFSERMTVRAVLGSVIRQLPEGAVYLVNQDYIEIMSRHRPRFGPVGVRPEGHRVDGESLRGIIDNANTWDGLTVLVDPRCERIVSNRPMDGIEGGSLRGVLRTFADANQLKLIIDDDRVLLMPRGAYHALLKADIEEAEVLAEIAKLELIIEAAKPPVATQPAVKPAVKPVAKPAPKAKTVARAASRFTLDDGIFVEALGVPLSEAIDDVRARTKLPIDVDPRAAEEMKRIVHLDVQATTSVRGLLQSLADMHHLKLVIDDDRILLIPRAAHLASLRDGLEETRLRAEVALIKQKAIRAK